MTCTTRKRKSNRRRWRRRWDSTIHEIKKVTGILAEQRGAIDSSCTAAVALGNANSNYGEWVPTMFSCDPRQAFVRDDD